ncbi:MAG: ExbD/TolR family protein [Crocinitomicaceae bacterium]
MARRELEEINAGSMADIAFLLLIFFIVTTTMDLEAGIPKMLPMKVEIDDKIELPEVRERDVFSITLNSQDQLLVEKENVDIERMEEMLYDFYTGNMYQLEAKPKQVEYKLKEKLAVEKELVVAKKALAENEDNIIAKSKVAQLEKTLRVISVMPNGKFLEISEQMAIQLKKQSKTSYGLYISVINSIGKVAKRIKNERCKEVFNGYTYDELNPEIEADLEKIEILDIMVPTRTLEPKITI